MNHIWYEHAPLPKAQGGARAFIRLALLDFLNWRLLSFSWFAFGESSSECETLFRLFELCDYYHQQRHG